MTEDQARTKRCPHPRLIDITVGNTTFMNRPDPENKCLASDCMLWEWDRAFNRDDRGNITGGNNRDTEGHCGLVRGNHEPR